MRNILFLSVLLALLWVGWNKVQEIQAVGAADGKPIALDLPSESPFATSFEEQFLCFDLERDVWRMFFDPDAGAASDCTGPYIDSSNLCAAMTRNGVEAVDILGRGGRELRCS